MLSALTLILTFQVIGEFISQATGIPVPGPVIGMILMLLAFFLKDDLVDTIRPTGGVLLSNLSLLFVPAGVGLMRHFERFLHEGLAIGIALIASTIIAMLTTAFVVKGLIHAMHLDSEA